MISRYVVCLNGISMESLHSSILLTDVSYPPTEYEREVIGSISRNGARIHRAYKEKTEVTVRFMIRAYGIAERQSICQQINRWAKRGGTLTVNDRPGQQLECVCDSFPAISSVRGWTDELEIKFTGYAIPYWQDIVPTEVEITGTSGTKTQYIPGNAPWSLVEATIVANAPMTGIEIDIGGYEGADPNTFLIEGMSLVAGDVVAITYDKDAFMSIGLRDTSLLSKHSGKDDLIASCGEVNTFTYSADGNCTVTFTSRGWWE